MKNFFKFKIVLVLLFIFLLGCETLDLDQTADRSTPDSRFNNPTNSFNYIQLELKDFVDSANDFTQRVTRQMAMTGGDTYDNAFEKVSFNQNWSVGYGILEAIKITEPLAIEKKNYYVQGASKIVKAYVLMTLVDIYGDVPYTEALNPAILEPKYDNGADVYKQAIISLDEGIAIMATAPSSKEVIDLYYAKNAARWVTLAKTLKLKMYVNCQLSGVDIGVNNINSAVAAIFAENDLIDNDTEDFVFRFGANRNTPNSRHPLYNDQYELGGGAYIANYFLWAVTVEKGKPSDFDPRAGFYFYKQRSINSGISIIDVPGRTRPQHYNETNYNSFFDPNIRSCYTVSNWTGQNSITTGGYLGRDHGNNAGTPPDANIRSVVGVYPVGGAFGNLTTSAASSVQRSGVDGAVGAGIIPIFMSSYVQFLKAEAILKLGVSGDAKLVMKNAISKSIDRVVQPVNGYPVLSVSNLATIASKKLAYLDFVDATYESLLSSDKRLELITKEYYIALWGNGIEAYNNYRRTGFPSNMQPTLEFNSGPFYFSALYPANVSSNNPNAPKEGRTRRVFWDKFNFNLK